jgi:hypothetical protein
LRPSDKPGLEAIVRQSPDLPRWFTVSERYLAKRRGELSTQQQRIPDDELLQNTIENSDVTLRQIESSIQSYIQEIPDWDKQGT